MNLLGFTAGVRSACFFCDQADLERYSRLKNQSASIDASRSAVLISSANTIVFQTNIIFGKKPAGLGVNKRNLGYRADFEWVK